MNPRLQQPCPVCGAGPGQNCRALNQKAYAKPRRTMHRERRAAKTEPMNAVLRKMRAAKPEEFDKVLGAFSLRSGHGTTSRYASGCRCPECRNAKASYEAERRNKLRNTLPPGDPRHGTTNGYRNFGCRCDLCMRAAREYAQNLRERTRLAVPR